MDLLAIVERPNRRVHACVTFRALTLFLTLKNNLLGTTHTHTHKRAHTHTNQYARGITALTLQLSYLHL